MKLLIPATTTQIRLLEDFPCHANYGLKDTAQRNNILNPQNEWEAIIPIGTVLEIRSYDLKLAASDVITFKIISIPQVDKIRGLIKTIALNREEASKIEFELV